MNNERFQKWTDTIKSINDILVDYGKLDAAYSNELDKRICFEVENGELKKKIAQLEDELAQAHEVIKGYHDSVLKELDLDEAEKLADLQFEKGVKND